MNTNNLYSLVYRNDDYLNQERTCSNKKGPMILRTPSFEELIVNYDDFPGEYHFSFSLNTDGIFKTYYVVSYFYILCCTLHYLYEVSIPLLLFC